MKPYVLFSAAALATALLVSQAAAQLGVEIEQ